MTSLPSRLARWVPRFRVPIMALILVLGLIGASLVPRIEGEFSPQALFASFPEEEAFAQLFIERYGSAENTLLIVVRSDDLFAPERLAWLWTTGERIRAMDGVERVQSIVHSPLPRSEGDATVSFSPLLDGPDVTPEQSDRVRAAVTPMRSTRGALLSDTGRLAILAVVLDRERRQVAEITPWVEDIRAAVDATPPPEGMSHFFAGLPHIRVHVVGRLIGDQLVLIPLAGLINLIFLFAAFRWVPGVVLPLTAVGLTLCFLLAGMVLAEERFNLINNVLPTLIIVIGISDSIHLINRYREEIRAGEHQERAIRTTVRTMASACFFTSVTTAVGFGSLLVSQTELLQRFGVTAAMGVLTAYLVTILFLPAALTWFRPPRHLPRRGEDGIIEAFAVRTHHLALRFPRLIVGVSSVVLVLAAITGSRVVVDSSLLELFDKDDPIHIQTRLLEDELGGVLSFDLALHTERPGGFEEPDMLHRAEDLARWIEESEGVIEARMWTDLLRDMRSAWTGSLEAGDEPFSSRAQIAQLSLLMADGSDDPSSTWVTPDRSELRINVRSADRGSRAMIAAVTAIEDAFSERFPDDIATMRFSGDSYLASLGLDLLIRDLIGSIAMAFGFIFIILLILFRSLRLGLIAFPPNVIPLILTLGYMALRDIPLNSTTLIIFSVSLGLAVDNTIHVVTRYLDERREGKHRDEALEAVARGTGRAVLVSSLLLLCGLSVVLASSFVPIRLFAELTALTILSCVLADLLILPALIHQFTPDGRSTSS